MITHARIRWLLAAALSGLPMAGPANGLRLVSQDGFASARGEAFVATADNPSAIHYNPAGISQLDGAQLRCGLYGIHLDPTFRPPESASNRGQRYHIQDRLAGAPGFFATHTLAGRRLGVGLGLYAPYGGDMRWPQDTGFRTVALAGALRYVTFHPVAALQLSPALALGGGVMVNYADLEWEQGLLRNYRPPYANSFRFHGDGWSAGYNLGLLCQPHPRVALGLTFRSAAAITFTGHTEFEQFPVIAATRRSARCELQFPLGAAFGISYRPTPRWNLECDADYTDWGSFGTTTIHQQPPAPPWPVQADIPVTFGWQPSWMYSCGVTRYLRGGWHVSVGYVFNENSVPDAHYTPLAADLDRHFLSAGAGRRGRRWDFDVVYQFGYGPAHRVSGSQPSSTPGQFAGQNADGVYDFISHAILLTLGMRF